MHNDKVTLYHSETGQPWECPTKAVDYWVEHGYSTEPVAPSGASRMTKDELLAEAARRDIPVPEGATNPQIIDALTGENQES